MLTIALTEGEVAEAMILARKLAARFASIEDEQFLLNAPVAAHDLPLGLRHALNELRIQELSGISVIKNLPINDALLGPTPAHWKAKATPSPTIESDIILFLVSCLLGDPIGWATQQEGYILHDVLPIKGHENEQLGSSSEALLTWHTEDAFHPYRTDYLALMCLRNPDLVETTFATMDDVKLSDDVVDVLTQPRFVIRPDESHQARNRGPLWRDLGASDALLRRSCDRIDMMNQFPEKVAVLFGDRRRPYVRLDPYFMEEPKDDDEAADALKTLISAIENEMQGVALRPGDILILDNFRVVHGRKPFKARHDGTDRWLKRLNIARDLRKSRDARPHASCRVIF